MRLPWNGYWIAIGVAASSSAVAGCARREPSSVALSSSSTAAVAPEAAAPDPPSASPFTKEMVERVVNPDHLPTYSGPTGSVEGTIYVIGPSAPDVKVDTSQCPAAIDTYGKLFREGSPSAPDGPRALADAVVIAVGYGGYFLPEKSAAQSVTISERCGYPQRTLAITFGERLEISNASKYPFAPRIDSDSSPAVMMAAPMGAGDPIRLYPSRPGHSAMGDIMQPFVREDVYVLRHPLHAVSGLDGHYRIDGVPVGKISIRAQHPTVASEAQSPVTIESGVVQNVDITLEYAPKAAPAKLDDKREPMIR